jgi:hypothetical protein
MSRRFLFLATLVVLPITTATAQRARSQATKHEAATFGDDNMPKGPAIRGRDLEDANPIKLLIDKRKDLKLTDAQLDGLKKSEGTVKEKNQPLYKAIDSLAREAKPSGNPNPEAEARVRNARRDLEGTISTILDDYDTVSKEAVGSLDAEQQTKANELLAKLKDERTRRIRDRMKSGD